MKMVGRESTKLPTKTPKMAMTSLLSRNFVFERKWGFDKMGTFGQNPCLFGENGYQFYQEHTVTASRFENGIKKTTKMGFKIPKIPVILKELSKFRKSV